MADISSKLRGNEIQNVWKTTDGRLVIECKDGYEVHIVWMNEEGNPTTGEPAVVFQGINIRAKTAHVGAAGGVLGGG